MDEDQKFKSILLKNIQLIFGILLRSSSILVQLLKTPFTFLTPRYSAVVPENSEPGTLVTQIKAEDPDMGAAGTVHYALADADIGNSRLYRIEPATGEIFTKTILTGKGRRAPYVLIVRAIDDGEPQLFTDTEVYITVGDVSSNDGVPAFVSPAAGDAIAYVPENSQPGSF